MKHIVTLQSIERICAVFALLCESLSASSDLYDISALPSDQITMRTETIRVRWWFDSTVTVRETVYGPVISDAPPLSAPSAARWALKWVGHLPTDELSAMLAVNRARNWTEFQTALKDFAVAPQNFLYADVEGNIGHLLATQLPRRSLSLPTDIIRSPSEHTAWTTMVPSQELPWSFNPPAGFLASANNQGADAHIPLGYFFSPNDRITRMQTILEGDHLISPEVLERLQQDVYQSSSVALRDALVSHVTRLDASLELTVEDRHVFDILRTWDGFYGVASRGALAFEAFMVGFSSEVFSATEKLIYFSIGHTYTLILEDLDQIEDSRLIAAFKRGFDVAAQTTQEHQNWGEIHRLSIAHLLGLIPISGTRYRYDELLVGGSRDTLLKTGHTLTTQPHLVRFGANARYVADLSTLDRNWFVLLGGQDGWFNSANFRDQVDPWQRGDYIQLPLDLDRVKTSFPYHTVFVSESRS